MLHLCSYTIPKSVQNDNCTKSVKMLNSNYEYIGSIMRNRRRKNSWK